MITMEGSVYRGHNYKVYLIYPECTELIYHEAVDYIVAEAILLRSAGTLKEAEDELRVLIELHGNTK